jgi:DNA/RNA-binding domain of Phe-tRNA-synthetase-like protein
MRLISLKIENELQAKNPGLDVLQFHLPVLIRKTDPDLELFKKAKQESIRGRVVSLGEVKDLPIIRAYRDFYWKVGIDPTKTRPAGEALLRRIIAGKDLPTINSLVDSYNLASADTMISIAAFDAGKVSPSDLVMRTSRKGELFAGIGMNSHISLQGVEVVIEDTLSRKLVAVYPYRDAEESKVTEATEAVLFMMCGVPGIRASELEWAKETTLEYVGRFCGRQSEEVRKGS